MSETWRDVAETWLSVIALRRQMISPLVLTILDSIVEDEKVLDALGMAEALISTVGQPPRELLTRLNQGPGAHIRKHAYEYSRSINAEIALIDRIRDAQAKSFAVVISATLGAMISVGNVVGRFYYDFAILSPTAAAVLAGCVAAVMLLCALGTWLAVASRQRSARGRKRKGE